ncbi:MAG: putative ABC transporter permease subunit [bacterium]
MTRLLNPSLLSIKRTFLSGTKKNRIRIIGLFVLAAGFFTAEYLFIARMLVYFSETELIGQLLIEKMLYMANFIFFAMLVFSNIITSISTYYTADDIPLILSAPITLEEFFYNRLIQTVIKSSWMIVLFGLPIYIAYGIILHGGFVYYLIMLVGLLAFIFIASSTGILFTIIVTYILPARRFRELMLFISITVFIGIYIGFRVIRPERFLNPQRFENVMGYLATLRSSQSLLLPSTWFSSTLMMCISHLYIDALYMFLPLLSTAMGITVVGMFGTYLFYRNGFTKAQESKNANLNKKGRFYRLLEILTNRGSIFVRAIIKKDVLSFFRDASQWSQLLLLGALIIVYVYNFTALPLKNIPFPTLYLKNIIAFLNLGLAAFVITAISARFAFPSVSLEGRALWLIKVSPNDIAELIRAKIVYNLVPLIIMGIALIYFTNHVLGVFSYIMYLSIITMVLLTVAITNMGVSFGAIYPKYHYENVADISMGFGGLVFMITSLSTTMIVLMVEAVPTYRVMKVFTHSLRLHLYDYVWISLLYLLAVSIVGYSTMYVKAKAIKAIKMTEG